MSAPLTDAVLWISRPSMMLERLGGMRILERHLFTLARAGIRRVWVTAQQPKDSRMRRFRWPDGLQVFWVSMVDDREVECRPPYIGLSADHLIRLEALTTILARPHARPTSYQDSAGRGVLQVIPFRHDNFIQYGKSPLPKDACVPLQTSPDVGPALPWLLRGAVKAHDGFMARHFDRRISLAVTRRLLNARLKPNHMTIFSSAIGLFGAGLFLGASRSRAVAGALVVWLHTLLDGCDGEMARLLFQESRLGGILDFWGDNVVHMALFVCMGIGLSRAHSSHVFMLPGAVAAISVLFSALLVFWSSTNRTASKNVGPLFDGMAVDSPAKSPESEAGRLRQKLALVENLLAQRDFIYLLVLCAFIDRLEEFLWAAGVGTPLFLAALLYLRKAGAHPKALRQGMARESLSGNGG